MYSALPSHHLQKTGLNQTITFDLQRRGAVVRYGSCIDQQKHWKKKNIFTDQDSLIKIFLSDVFYDLSECGGIVYCNDPYITDSIMSELQEKEYEWIQDNPEYLEDDPDRLYDEMKQNL